MLAVPSRSWRTTSVVAVLLATACGSDPAGPGSGSTPLTVTVRVAAVAPPVYGETPEGLAVIGCTVALEATVTGAGSATWRTATFRWYLGADLSEPFDSATLTPSEVSQSWGNGAIGDGATQRTQWLVSATLPFTVSLEFSYRRPDGSAALTLPAVGRCTPPVPPQAGPPQVTSVTTQPSSGAVGVGDTLSVSYTASGAAGLWQTIVGVSGACDTVVFRAEHLAASTTRTVQIPVTASCTLGSPLTVTVLAIDGAAAIDSRSPTGPLTVADLDPPELYVTLLDWYTGQQPVIHGDFFVGDTLDFYVSVSDNLGLRSIEWEVLPSGVHGSLAISGLSPTVPLRIPVGPGWGARPQLRLYATDAAGLRSAEILSPSDSMRIYPDHPRAMGWGTYGTDIEDARVDGRRNVAYLLGGNQYRVFTVGLPDAHVLTTLDLPSFASGFDFTASGDSLVFAFPLLRAIGVLDLTGSGAPLSLLPLTLVDSTGGQFLGAIRVTSRGQAIVAIGGPPGAGPNVLEVDLATGTERLRADAGISGRVVGGPERSPLHDRLAFWTGNGEVQLYDAGSDQFGPPTLLPEYGGAFTFSADRQLHGYGLQVLDPSLQLLRRVTSTFGTGGVPTFLSPDGQSLYYVDGYRGLIQTRVSDGGLVDRTWLPFFGQIARVSDDGQWAVFFSGAGYVDNPVGVVDLR